jgi:hypothetical protein
MNPLQNPETLGGVHMKLLFKDRSRIGFLACMVAGGLVLSVGRGFGWPSAVSWALTLVAITAVLLSLMRWVRRAPDANGHIR